ncbi:hypothetical protein NMY233_1520 [Neisseria meningitidis NM233]|nr:hypothetical protein NMY220_1540 [Neisseria meningitidis NM220]EHP14949.1 hypothetical protein NMY233_1520 [Neisseria meningitidis NM233]
MQYQTCKIHLYRVIESKQKCRLKPFRRHFPIKTAISFSLIEPEPGFCRPV